MTSDSRSTTSGLVSSADGNDNQARGFDRSSHLLTVVVEDYFHVAPLKSVVQSEQWYRFERRVEANTHKALDLLDEHGVAATFFVLGSIADEMPELVREIADRGHEVASKGYVHRSIRHFGREEFREDLLRSREALEKASGCSVKGFRIGHRWFGPDDMWALDVLADEGFAYDSSVRPLYFAVCRQAVDDAAPTSHDHNGRKIWEFPLASWTVGGWSVPISGGNYFRQLPHWMVRRAVASWIKRDEAPFLMYFHVWELDPDQPRIPAAPWTQRVRQYRHLDRMEPIIRCYLERYRFTSISRLPRSAARHEAGPRESFWQGRAVSRAPDPLRVPVTVVIPCFNEEIILPYLANTLKSVRSSLGSLLRSTIRLRRRRQP